jgi:HlyD family secretion protein
MRGVNLPENGRSGAGRKPYRIVGTALLVVVLGLVAVWLKVVRGGENPASTVATFAARRGPLTVSVLEAGSLRAKDPVILRSALPRRATIISIVPEGTYVHEGDLLVELDVSALVDHLLDHEIMLKNGEAAWINARENLVITQSQAQSSIELAQLKYDFAVLDLKKYQGEGGQFATDLAEAKGRIKLNEEEVKKNEDYHTWSKRLYDEKYLSQTQLQTDQLALEKSKLNLQVAGNNLKLLEEYNSKRQLAQLTSDVTQAEMALERAKAKARATIAQAEAYLSAREQAYKNEQERLSRHEEEVAQSKIYAPTDGMVIYATSRGSGSSSSTRDDRRPLADGVEVWERQELIYLTRSTSTVAEISLHEASLQKVRVGLPVLVTVDALPGKKIMGTVTRIAPLPDSQSMYMNPDLKVYKTEIALDNGDPSLRSGMNCRAEIIVEQHRDTVYVPIQTVVRVGGQPTVYVLKPSGSVEERKIEIGLDDNRMVRVVSGLGEGELVLLAPPLKAGTVRPGSRLVGIRSADVNEMAEQINEKLKAANEPAPGPHAANRRSSEPPASTAAANDAGPPSVQEQQQRGSN